MELISVGITYKTAPIEVRERLYYQGKELEELLQFLTGSLKFREAAVLSTCNRTEIYTVSEDYVDAEAILKSVLVRRAGSEFMDTILRSITVFESTKMVRHLLRVAVGIESMVLGEGQILGQVREAGDMARSMGTSGPVLNTLFNQAVAAGKRSRSETAISRRPVSIAHVAVDLARRIFDGLEGKHVLMIGAGKMSTVAVQYLVKRGASNILVANRTREKADALAQTLSAHPIDWKDLEITLRDVDLVITSTSAPGGIISKQLIEQVMWERGGRPLVLVDIAIPRDVEPSVGALDNVHLYNLDHLQGVVDANLRERGSELPKVLRIVEEEEANFFKWFAARSAYSTEKNPASDFVWKTQENF